MTASAGTPACRLRLTIGPPPDLPRAGESFSLENWQLLQAGPENILRVGPPPKRGRPDNIVVFNADYSEGAMYQNMVFELFRRFIDQFLFINLLSQRDGFLLHASGVAWEGKGLAFIGRSGAGKSTLLNLFRDEVSRRSLLNDDRLALRKQSDGWRLYGTPWYGESRVSSPSNAPLSALFFLTQSKHNYVRVLSPGEACRRLMPTALVPFWNGAATSRVLEAFQGLVGAVPAYELGFLPDKSAVELIKKTVSSVIARPLPPTCPAGGKAARAKQSLN